MSQAKVDRYKQEKANRQKTMKKEKHLLLFEKFCGVLLIAALVFWAGYSIYTYKPSSDSTEQMTTTQVDLDALYDYYGTLQ